MESPDPFEHFKLEVIDRRQLQWRTVDVERLVADDHAVRAIWELSGQMNLRRFYATVGSEREGAGRSAIDPRLLVSLWVYGYSRGISSAREISRLCEYDPAFQWLTGMRVINHHTLSDFRTAHGEALNDLFTQMLGLLTSEGLLTLERVTQDGTKIRANAGADTFRSQERLEGFLQLAREQLKVMAEQGEEIAPRLKAAQQRAQKEREERLSQALETLQQIQNENPAKKEVRVSTTDPAARVMKDARGGYGPSYNLQITADACAGAIVDTHVTTEAEDSQQLDPAVERVERRVGEKPKQIVADAQYTTHGNVLAMDRAKVDFIGCVRAKPGSGGTRKTRGIRAEFGPEAFVHEAGADVMRCPAGQVLTRERTHHKPYRHEIYYRASPADCAGCPFRMQCTPHAKARGISRSTLRPELENFRRRMKTPEAREIYKQRGAIAEFPNAWIKSKFNMRQFRLRGLVKVNLEALWAGLTYNIQLWIRAVWRPALVA